ncbi:hypothetical protein QZH41_018302 [Actinostola sp. cb2023]|nr:hypothetical protein QZH41_018302 [Actinostola sp. cb2023]
MGKRCVVSNCGNSSSNGFHMHKFPKDLHLTRQWTKFVQTRRADFQQPSQYSVICSAHFTEDCYEKSYMAEMGLKKQTRLVPGAVPTIHPVLPQTTERKRSMPTNEAADAGTTTSAAFTKKRSRAVEKLEANRSNEVPNSSWCEHEGLIRMLNFAELNDLHIDSIITDRNRQNAAYIRIHLKPNGTKHYYDIWHIAKGIGKKIDALAKQKECEVVGLWRKSIVNHLYWVAASAGLGEGREDMLQQMWTSVSNHIQDVHEGHSDIFQECAHGPLNDDDRDKEWLEPGYTESLLELLVQKYSEDSTALKNSIQDISDNIPPPLAASYEKPDKMQAIEEYTSRFVHE